MKKSTKNYKTFDQAEANEKAQQLLDKIKKQQKPMKYIRIDADTIIEIKASRKNIEQIVQKIKNKQQKTTIEETIEYGHYA